MADVSLPDGSVVSFPDEMPEGDMVKALSAHVGSQSDNSGFFGGAAQAAGSLAQNLSAAAQGTSPIVRSAGGAPQYQPLGEAVPGSENDLGKPAFAAGGRWMPIDPTQHVVLNDPDTGKPMVYQRSPQTNEGLMPSLGRLLGFGAIAPTDIPIPNSTAAISQAIGNRFGSPERKALNQIGGALRADVEAQGPGPQEITGALSAAGAPSTVMDVAGENVRGLAGQVARMPGPGRQQVMEALNERDAMAGPRLAQVTNDMAANGPSNFLAADALNQQAKTAAAPLYGKAYLAPPMNPDLIEAGGALDKLMDRPAMQKAAINALSIAKEEGRDPMSLGITFNSAGDAAFEKVPSWQTLDYVKRGLDDVLNGYRDTTTGKLVLDEGGAAVNNTRKTFLGLLDRENPDYAAAREAYAGPQQSRGALLQGSQVFNKDPDQIASEISSLSPNEQQFYRLGAANALKTQLAKTSSGGDEARALIGNAYRQQQLKSVFPNADDLISAAQTEAKMFGTKQAVLGNSATATRLAQDQVGEGGGIMRPLAEAATAFATHEPMLAAKSGFSALQALFRNGRLSPEVGSQIGSYLLSSDPQTARAWLMDAFQRSGPAMTQARPITPLVDLSIQPSQGLLPGERGRQ